MKATVISNSGDRGLVPRAWKTGWKHSTLRSRGYMGASIRRLHPFRTILRTTTSPIVKRSADR